MKIYNYYATSDLIYSHSSYIWPMIVGTHLADIIRKLKCDWIFWKYANLHKFAYIIDWPQKIIKLWSYNIFNDSIEFSMVQNI